MERATFKKEIGRILVIITGILHYSMISVGYINYFVKIILIINIIAKPSLAVTCTVHVESCLRELVSIQYNYNYTIMHTTITSM